jgi:SpoVK/Ycf46/Vps4 family AAA+-type ATPase
MAALEETRDGLVVDFGKTEKEAKKWSVDENKYYACADTTKRMPSGCYGIESNDKYGYYFSSIDKKTDELIMLPDTVTEDIINNINEFWDNEQKFKDNGFLWKRGVLLYGPPGGGKSVTVNLIVADVIKNGGLALYITDTYSFIGALKLLRKIEPNRRIVIVFEDIEALFESEYKESKILSLLDGEAQVENVVFVATTNYPEKLQDRVKNRPSRFDLVKFVGYPNEKARRIFITHKNKRLSLEENKIELDLWVEKTVGMSVAHIKEMIISVECFGNTIYDVLENFKEMKKEVTSDDFMDTRKPIGFIGRED